MSNLPKEWNWDGNAGPMSEQERDRWAVEVEQMLKDDPADSPCWITSGDSMVLGVVAEDGRVEILDLQIRRTHHNPPLVKEPLYQDLGTMHGAYYPEASEHDNMLAKKAHLEEILKALRKIDSGFIEVGVNDDGIVVLFAKMGSWKLHKADDFIEGESIFKMLNWFNSTWGYNPPEMPELELMPDEDESSEVILLDDDEFDIEHLVFDEDDLDFDDEGFELEIIDLDDTQEIEYCDDEELPEVEEIPFPVYDGKIEGTVYIGDSGFSQGFQQALQQQKALNHNKEAFLALYQALFPQLVQLADEIEGRG